MSTAPMEGIGTMSQTVRTWTNEEEAFAVVFQRVSADVVQANSAAARDDQQHDLCCSAWRALRSAYPEQWNAYAERIGLEERL